MIEASYGSRPDLLPPSIVRLTRRPGAGARWVPRVGVDVLTYDEHALVERRALGPLPRRSDGTVEWDRCRDRVVFEREAEPVLLADEVRRMGRSVQAFVIMPGNLVIPSIRVPTVMAADVVMEMATRSTELWVLSVGGRVVLEYAYFRDTLVAGSVVEGP